MLGFRVRGRFIVRGRVLRFWGLWLGLGLW